MECFHVVCKSYITLTTTLESEENTMKFKLKTLTLSALLFYNQALTAFASGWEDSGNAVQDIMNDERFAGAMSSIDWISGFIDHYMTMAITLVAFFIISAALFRNVCAAAYCSNNKFWNKVAEAHEAADGASLASIAQGIKGLPSKTWGGAGGIKGTLLCLVPNIKALTDFDDVDMEPKHYWMKAIPQMLACIVIGVFVYNGYYRDTAAVVGDIGSEVVSRALSSVDASDFVDSVLLTTGTPDNIYEHDTSVLGQMNYAISSKLYTAFRAAWDVSSTEQKTKLMRNCEVMAQELTSNCKEYFTTDVNSNKVMKLSGVEVGLAGASNLGKGSTPINGSGWYGVGVDDITAIFSTKDDGKSYSFNVCHKGPDCNGETANPAYIELNSWCTLSGSIVEEDGDSRNQDTNILSQAAIGIGGASTLVTVTNVPLAVPSSAIEDSGTEINGTYLANASADACGKITEQLKSVLGENYTDVSLGAVTLTSDHKKRGSGTDPSSWYFSITSASSNGQYVYKCQVKYTCKFTSKRNGSDANGTCEAIVTYSITTN